MSIWKGAPYTAMRTSWDRGRTYEWGVFPMPGGNAVARFRGPFAGKRARHRARNLYRKARR